LAAESPLLDLLSEFFDSLDLLSDLLSADLPSAGFVSLDLLSASARFL
jgi:hypothetical protein